MLDLKCSVVVITGYEAFQDEDGALNLTTLSLRLNEEFPELLEAVLSYDSTYPEWRSELDLILNKFDARN